MNTKRLYFFNLVCRILPLTHFYQLKVRLLRWSGAKVGDNVQIFSPKIYGDFDLEIGDNVWIGHEALIMGASGSKITIHDFAKIGTRSILVTGYHEYSIKYNNIAGPGLYDDIIIMRGATVGTQAMVLPGKTVGEKAHVAAGSIVTHDVPSFHRVAGVPARVIRDFRVN